VFQSFALYPWLSVFDNIEEPLKARGLGTNARKAAVERVIYLVGLGGFEEAYPRELSGGMKQRVGIARALAVERVFGPSESRAQLKARTHAALELVGMGHASTKRPHEISGGMKQRVGIARALAMEPKVLLLDEPFGALDALTRAHLQDELLKIVARTRSTVLMVTHDVDEAVLLSDRIVMMTNGPAATIGEILSVELPRPRNRVELAEDARYVHYRKEVLDFLYTRHGHVERVAA